MMWILWLSFIISISSAAPVLQSGRKYAKEDITVLGDSYSVGFFDLQFNSDLYMNHPYGSPACFTNQSCHANNLPCPPCDWTDPDICSGTTRGSNSSCPCVIPPLICSPSKYPYGTAVWPRGSNSTGVITITGNVDIPFHPNPPDNCSCIIFKMDTVEGKLQGLIAWYGEVWLGNSS
jgi:hypothetical protein